MSIIKNIDHLLDFDIIPLHLKQIFIKVPVLPLQKFLNPVLLLSDGVLEQGDLLLIALIERIDGLAEVQLVLLELLDACLKRVGMWGLIVHLNLNCNN